MSMKGPRIFWTHGLGGGVDFGGQKKDRICFKERRLKQQRSPDSLLYSLKPHKLYRFCTGDH
jgi:hypothetical protein